MFSPPPELFITLTILQSPCKSREQRTPHDEVDMNSKDLPVIAGSKVQLSPTSNRIYRKHSEHESFMKRRTNTFFFKSLQSVSPLATRHRYTS